MLFRNDRRQPLSAQRIAQRLSWYSALQGATLVGPIEVIELHELIEIGLDLLS